MNQPFEFPPGATPLDDITGLIPKWVQDLKDLNRVETENIALAKRAHFQGDAPPPSRWFRPKTLLAIHKEMFGQVWEWAGTFRKTLKTIGPAPYLVPMHLAELCSDVHSWQDEPVSLTFLERSARIHHQLVSVHPFENGNGRFSRFVADLYLHAWKCPYPIWPTDLHDDSPIRPQYITAIQAADHGDYAPLLKLMIAFGAREPATADLKVKPFYRKKLTHSQLEALLEARLRLTHAEVGS